MPDIYDDFIEISEEKEGFFFKDTDCFLEYKRDNQDYCTLVKITPKDLGHDRAVYILFGGGETGSTKAVDFFIKHHKKIYNKFKDHHYFIAIPVNRKDQSLDWSEGIIDLTSIAFKENMNLLES